MDEFQEKFKKNVEIQDFLEIHIMSLRCSWEEFRPLAHLDFFFLWPGRSLKASHAERATNRPCQLLGRPNLVIKDEFQEKFKKNLEIQDFS